MSKQELMLVKYMGVVRMLCLWNITFSQLLNSMPE